ncbi:MAG: class I SAM-dependent methyltransferase [Gammaproteobacteria bacterium]|nr:class I SAM-dependent methyltransferase [Gammaproteobacteria bacterium]
MNCLVCSSENTQSFENYSSFNRVTSDCKPFAADGKLNICQTCGLVQKTVDDKWLAEITSIYKNYEVYSQSDGEEQAIFNQTTGNSCKRSDALTQFINNTNLLIANGKVLDYGCANGEFLAAFSSTQPNWKLYGADLDEKYLERLKKINNFVGLYNETNIPAEQFNLISLIHTLEHLVTPLKTLKQLKKLLPQDGALFIQVPNVLANPFDILIADHLSHFSPATLTFLLQQAGFKVQVITTDRVPREISVLATPAPKKDITIEHTTVESQATIINNHLEFLQQILNNAEKLETQGEFAIFGSSISATWLASHFENVICFIDEDPNRIGKTHQGKPIYSINEIPQAMPIYIPLPLNIATSISHRHAKQNLNFILPPNIRAVENVL